jgi:MerR family transcriptional regulator, light-induced transcriptional regulator
MNTLASNIKMLRTQKHMSQKELAELLAISQTSIAHYESGDRQPTIDTLIQLSSVFEISIDELVGNVKTHKTRKSLLDSQEIIDSLTELLVNKKDNEFFNFITEISKEYSIETLIDLIIKQVLYKIGFQWEVGLITEADEHYATNMIRKTMNVLTFKNPVKLKQRRAISLAVQSEQHTLGIEMVSAFLENSGIETLYLGSNIPIKSLNRLIDDYEPDYIFISVTLNEHINSLIALIDSIHVSHEQTPRIIIGGQSAHYARRLLDSYPHILFLDTLDQLVELIA